MTPSIRLEHVFTSRHLAGRHSFVRRRASWDRVVGSIRQQGMLLVYGPFRVGKTSLAIFAARFVKRTLVHVPCDSKWTSFAELKHALAYAFPKGRLERYLGPIGRIIVNIVGNWTGAGTVLPESDSDTERVAHRVDVFLRRTFGVERRRPFVVCIDDLHRLRMELVGPLVEFCKDNSEGCSYVFIASGGEAQFRQIRSAIDAVPDALGRVAEMEIQPWSETELQEVLSRGEEALRIRFDGGLRKKLVQAAGGDIARLHALAYNCCVVANMTSSSAEIQSVKESAYRDAIREYYGHVDQRVARRLNDIQCRLVTSQGRALFRELLDSADRNQVIPCGMVEYTRDLARRLVLSNDDDLDRVLSELVTGPERLVEKNERESYIMFKTDEAREAWSRLRVRDDTMGGWDRVYNAMLGVI